MDPITLISLGLVLALMAGLTVWFRWRHRTALPVILPDGRGLMRLPRGQLLFFVLGFLALAAVLGSLAVQGGGTPARAAAAIVGLFGLALLLTLTPAYNLEWDEDGVIGPSGYGLLPVGARPVFLTWDEITSIHVDRLRSHVLTGRRGRRIVVYNIYGGKRIFLQLLLSFRPDLNVTAG